MTKFVVQVRDTAPPFRVLEKCQELCLRDRTPTNNLVRTCTSFDFQPGSRIASFSSVVEYDESTCYLSREQSQPEGIGTLVMVPNYVHYAEVCLSCKYFTISKNPVQTFESNDWVQSRNNFWGNQNKYVSLIYLFLFIFSITKN